MEIYRNLEQFKESGVVKFDKVLSIPVSDRLPELIKKYSKEEIHGVIVVLLTSFVNSFNLIRPMTAEQIVFCAFDLIETSYEDYLSVEDFTLFFQGAKSGKYGKVYDRLDQQTIFELFEIYRQERYEVYLRAKEEKDSNFKSMGGGIRTSDEKSMKDLMHEAKLEYFKNKNNEHTD